jgi:hypothetical protein
VRSWDTFRLFRLLETAHTALSVHFVEYYLIIHFGEYTHLGHAVWCVNLYEIFIVAHPSQEHGGKQPV